MNSPSWARIKVKGDKETSQTKVEAESDGYAYTIPICCEISAWVEISNLIGGSFLVLPVEIGQVHLPN